MWDSIFLCLRLLSQIFLILILLTLDEMKKEKKVISMNSQEKKSVFVPTTNIDAKRNTESKTQNN